MRNNPAICDATSATRSSPVPGGASTRGTTSRSATSSRKLRSSRSRPPVSADRTAATTAGWCGESRYRSPCGRAPHRVRAPARLRTSRRSTPGPSVGPRLRRATAASFRSSGVPAPSRHRHRLRSLGSSCGRTRCRRNAPAPRSGSGRVWWTGRGDAGPGRGHRGVHRHGVRRRRVAAPRPSATTTNDATMPRSRHISAVVPGWVATCCSASTA